MGFVKRFERKLEGAVDDAFARVFGGKIMPAEVESALRREADTGVRSEGGHALAPNHYVLTVSDSDEENLTADAELTMRSFAKHLATYIDDQGWQTYGDVSVELQASPTLHTGQFRARSTVDPGPPDNGPRSPQPTGAEKMSSTDRPDAPGPRYPLPSERYAQTRGESPAGNPPPADNPPSADNPPPTDNPPSAGNPPPAGFAAPARSYNQHPFSSPHAAQPPQEHPQAPGQPYQQQQPPQSPFQQNRQPQSPFQQPSAPQPAPPQRDHEGAEQRGFGQQGYPGQERQPHPPAPYPPRQDYSPQGYAPRPPEGYPQSAAPQGPPAPPSPPQNYPPRNYPPQNYPPQEYPQAQAPQGYPPQDYSAWSQPRVQGVRLMLDDGSGRTFDLRQGSNIIGRGQACHFRVPDTGVSRRHVDIQWDGTVALLVDMNSTNGTVVNGNPVTEWQLAHGDIIRIGHSDIAVQFR